jgi:signal transduction histidine kinase
MNNRADIGNVQDRVALAQKILIVLMFFSLPYVGLFYYFGHTVIALRLLIVEALFGICWFAGYKNLGIASRVGVVLITNGAIFYFSQFVGLDAGIQLLHFSMALIPLVLFIPEEKYLMFFSIGFAIFLFFLGSFFSFFASADTVFPVFQIQVIRNSVALATFFITLLSMNFLLKQLRFSNVSLKDSNQTLQTAYEDLQLQQNLLEKSWHDSVYAQLTRTIAHELKNPLFEFGMVIGALEKSLDDRETAMMFISSLATTIEELMELVNAMLESGGASVGEYKEIRISEVMNRVLILAEGSIKKTQYPTHQRHRRCAADHGGLEGLFDGVLQPHRERHGGDG